MAHRNAEKAFDNQSAIMENVPNRETVLVISIAKATQALAMTELALLLKKSAKNVSMYLNVVGLPPAGLTTLTVSEVFEKITFKLITMIHQTLYSSHMETTPNSKMTVLYYARRNTTILQLVFEWSLQSQ